MHQQGRPYRLKDWRIERLFSYRGLWRASGVHSSIVINIEKGVTSPSLATIKRLCKALNIRPAQCYEFQQSLERKKDSVY